ncbi:MAG: hypothetical protein ACJ74E_07560 [Actinomycetes bacterium]|jgi:hypothetical protein
MTQLDRTAQQIISLPIVDEWLDGLSPEQIDLLRAHEDDAELPQEVLALLKGGPLSPMLITEIKNNDGPYCRMPPAIRQALASRAA